MRLVIEKINGYYSSIEETIKELSEQAEQIVIIKGTESGEDIVKVLMVINE